MTILVMKADNTVREYANNLVKNFNALHQLKEGLLLVDSANSASTALVHDSISILIIAAPINIIEAQSLAVERVMRGDIPILTGESNYEPLRNILPKGRIITCHELSKEVIQGFILNEHPSSTSAPILDKRVIKSILVALPQVISENTGEKFRATGILDGQEVNSNQDLSVAIAFKGTGVSGHFVISAAKPLIHRLSERMGIDTAEIDDDIVNDVIGEIANQVFGLLQQYFLSFGLQITTVFQLVVSSTAHTLINQSPDNGPIFQFIYEHARGNLKIIFWSKNEKVNITNISPEKEHFAQLDVRGINRFNSILKQTFKKHGLPVPVRTELKPAPVQQIAGHFLYVVQLQDLRSNMAIAFSLPESTLKHMTNQFTDNSKDLLIKPEGIYMIKGLFEKVVLNYCESIQDIGYHVKPSFSGMFICRTSAKTALKCLGYYTASTFNFDRLRIDITYGILSKVSDARYDVWPYLMRRKGSKNG